VCRAYSLLGWFVVLFVVWAILVGTIQSVELYAGLAAAAVAAVLAEVLRTRGLLDFSVDLPALAKIWKAPGLILLDIGVITVELVRAGVRRERIRGSWVEVDYPVAPGARGRWQRLWGVALANGYANSVVLDYSDDKATMHVFRDDVITGKTVL
jgi:hypothetical protein